MREHTTRAIILCVRCVHRACCRVRAQARMRAFACACPRRARSRFQRVRWRAHAHAHAHLWAERRANVEENDTAYSHCSDSNVHAKPTRLSCLAENGANLEHCFDPVTAVLTAEGKTARCAVPPSLRRRLRGVYLIRVHEAASEGSSRAFECEGLQSAFQGARGNQILKIRCRLG